LVDGLSALTAQMDPKLAMITLVQIIKDDPGTLLFLQEDLPEAMARVKASGAHSAAHAATTIVQCMKHPKDILNLRLLAESLVAVIARMEAKDAAAVATEAATTLLQAIKDTKELPLDRALLARDLSALAAYINREQAATITEQAAKTLIQAMKGRTRPYGTEQLANALSALAPRMKPKAATATLVQAMTNSKEAESKVLLAQAMSALAARAEPTDAATISAALESALVQNVQDTYGGGAWQRPSALQSHVPSAAATASAVAFPANGGHPLAALAILLPTAEPPSCRLSDQQLVNVMKTPACIGPTRRAILDQLGNRYRRTFADVWEFVRYAQQQRLNLDFTTPPQRP
jgi:hypothetical protein